MATKDKRALAVIVGAAWAKRMIDKRVVEGGPIGGEWPGAPRMLRYSPDRSAIM